MDERAFFSHFMTVIFKHCIHAGTYASRDEGDVYPCSHINPVKAIHSVHQSFRSSEIQMSHQA